MTIFKKSFLFFRTHPFLILLLLFIVTRLTHLTLLPVFTDESNYLNWGWITVHYDPFYPLVDAKQPGLMWLFGLSQVIFSDPLWAGRFVSILFGLANLRLLYLISHCLFNSKVSFITSTLYLLSPIFLFYDRQALMESSLITVSLFTFLCLLKTLSHPSLKSTLLVFLTLGLGFWIKSSSLIFLLTAVVCLSFISLINRKFAPLYLTHLLLGLTLFIFLISPLFFQPDFISTWHRNSDYSLTLSQILKFPFPTWVATLRVNLQLWFLLLTPPVLIGSIIGFVFFLHSKVSLTEKLLPTIWLGLPLGLFLISAKFSGYMFQRYSTPFLPLFLIFAAFFFSRFSKTWLLLLFIPITVSLIQIFNPPHYFQLLSRFTAYSYIEGYITGNDTGFQVNAIMDYLKHQSQSGPIMVGHQLVNFNPTAGVFVYARKIPNLHPAYIGTLLPGYEKYDCVSTPQPLYLVSVADDLEDLTRFVDLKTVITNTHDSGSNSIYTLKSGCPLDRTAPLPYLDR